MDLKNGFFLLIIYGIKGKRGMVIEEMEDVLWISWRERKDRRKVRQGARECYKLSHVSRRLTIGFYSWDVTILVFLVIFCSTIGLQG